jgi:DNA-directed RNA polymerase subunit RPC12/RpoP
VSDTIKCVCTSCGAKYRLPVEAQGRTARCKQCGSKFEVPRVTQSLEDSIMAWLSGPSEDDTEETVDRPRVVNLPADKSDDSGAHDRTRGIIRFKSTTSKSE